MFFDGSMRSVRAITSRSPTASASAAAAARAPARDGDRFERGDVGAEAGDERRIDARSPTERGARRLPVRVGPAPGVESRGPRRERRAELGADVGRQYRQVVGAGEGRVGEVHDAQIGSLRAQLTGGQAELIVLHQNDLARGRALRDDVGEVLIDRNERVPSVTEAQVETRTPRAVEHPVVQEPQHAVRHDLVVHAVLFAVEVEEPHVDVEVARSCPPGPRRGRRRTSRPRSTWRRPCRRAGERVR